MERFLSARRLSAAIFVPLASFSMAGRTRPRMMSMVALAIPLAICTQAVAMPVADMRDYDIPAGTLEGALARFGRESGILLSFRPEVAAGVSSPGLQGRYSVQDGLAKLLSGTHIQVRKLRENSYLLIRDHVAEQVETLPGVVVSAASVAPALPEAYAGGLVARGSGLGILGVQDNLDTPFSTIQYTTDLLDNLQARTLADVVPNEAAVGVLTGSGGFGEDFQIRGFTIPNGDVGLNGLYGLASASRMPAIMMARVEVQKGPGTALHGVGPGGSIGGNINILTKRAGEIPLTRLHTLYQSNGQWGEWVDIGRRFGSNHTWGIRFNGAYRTGETGIDRSNQRQSIGVLGLDYAGVRLRGSVDAYIQHENADNVRPQVGFLPALVEMPSPPSGRENFFPETALRLEDAAVAARLDYDVTDQLTVYGAAGYRRGTADQLLPTGSVGPGGDMQVRNGYFDSYSRTWTADIGLRTHFRTLGVAHTVTLGMTRLEQEIGTSSGQTQASVPSNIYRPVPLPEMSGARRAPVRTSEVLLSSWYVADTMALADRRVLLTAGLRHQRVAQHYYPEAPGASIRSYDDGVFSPVAGIVFKPLDHVSLYANYASGVTRGGAAPGAAANAGQVFAPFRSRQYEAGIKIDWGRVTTEASVFQITLPSATIDHDTRLYAQDGEQRNRGLELSAYGEIARHLRVMGSAVFYDVTLTRTRAGLYDGNRAPGVPPQSYSLGLDWDTPWTQGLGVNLRMRYTSSMYFNAANTLKLPGWLRVDAGVRYRTRIMGRQVVLRANVENLFDRNAWLQSGVFATVNSPRTVLLSAQIDF